MLVIYLGHTFSFTISILYRAAIYTVPISQATSGELAQAGPKTGAIVGSSIFLVEDLSTSNAY